MLRQHREYSAQHTRYIFITEHNPVASVPGHPGLGVIDRINDIAIVEEIHQLLGSHDRTVLLRFGRTGADVREQQRIFAP